MSQLNLGPTIWVGLDMLLMVLVLAIPLRRRFHQHDQGDGFTEVALPKKPRSVHPVRGIVFFAVGASLSVLIVGFHAWLTFEYRNVLRVFVGWALAAPLDAQQAASHANPDLALVVASYFLCLAATVRASASRRLGIVLNGAFFLVLACLLDVAVALLGVGTGWPVYPGSLVTSLCDVYIGFLWFTRMVFVSFMLPKPTALPKDRPPYRRDTLMMAVVIGAGFAVAAMLLAWLSSPAFRGQSTQLLLSFFVTSSFFTVIALMLYGSRWLRRDDPLVLDPPPPINVIVAAYNEEDILAANLEAIDRAAVVYGGPVAVIVCNDGSADRTVEIAQSSMARFVAATGEVVTRTNGGIARAYNTAIAHCTADYIVRIDADTLPHEEAFKYAIRWLTDPAVGQVSALYLPRTDLPESWFHRMRLLECLFGFGFARQGHAVVDGVICAPGPFSAFRRDVALQLRGFTVGMNGEDLDLTNRVGRAGYRVILDPKCIAYEDVPYSLHEFREQRNRWSRAGIHCFSRFAPFCSGLAGPRSWFMFPRLFASRFSGPLRLLVLLHAIALALLVPAYRSTILIVGVLYLAASLSTFMVAVVLMVRYGFLRKIPWLIAWYPFLVLRRFVVLEGLLSLPTRPVAVREPLARLANQLRMINLRGTVPAYSLEEETP
jgi:cellulose synthase/poly-beta-1,6-N-acetylglucosamine synthase-like glycosyltransferase